MPKKIKFESFKSRFLVEASKCRFTPQGHRLAWPDFLRGLFFLYDKGNVLLSWQEPMPNRMLFEPSGARFYVRGDSDATVQRQVKDGLQASEDPIRISNEAYFNGLVLSLAERAGFSLSKDGVASRLELERTFHDAWAESEDVEQIDVRGSNEVCTAPEMRYIVKRLGDLKGKRMLDVGCGLGEASVYFAMLGAEVTSSDLSQGMLDATSHLAKTNGVAVRQHLASAEDMGLAPADKFDVIYAGNLLHHVDIDATLSRIRPHLADNGVLVTWDPLAYNPAINVYRSMATEVRTPDEHPLRWSDIRLFSQHFGHVETRYFWLFTLIIFVVMALAQRRDPNKERFWKVILKEGPRWAWLYRPLEAMDRLILSVLPPLRLLCWNVVVIARK
ncbi:MAG: methyltransferase [Gammaproteobacteria bacterium]|nr:methyltransferase [Gammaproteobacteria bacterium]MBU1603048.1 methyltransferase [Gammaproteobacteria bacterium]MBU2432080.1 methyltransferase [Gammaproteobacteria bacterium]MBU2448029.1 methyltransferase [Gammaproteobacteria bacterium]